MENIKFVCGFCGKKCKQLTWRVKRFCNRNCYDSYQRRNQVKLICKFCGVEKYVAKTDSERNQHCSRKCYIASSWQAKSRVCKFCKKEKPIDNFNKHTSGKDIRRRYCVECELDRSRKSAMKIRTRWMSSKAKAIRLDKIWDISFDAFEKLLSEQCHYCDGTLNKTGSGLDRKDNALGYLVDNVVPCCWRCNIVKMHHFTYEEMMLLSPALKQIQKGTKHAD